MSTKEILNKAKEAKKSLLLSSNSQRDTALALIAENILKDSHKVLEANKIDVDKSRGKLNEVMIDRLLLTEERIKSMSNGILDVLKLDSPVGKIINTVTRPNGLVIEKTLVPMGVISVIYESRPNVTSDVAALCLKSSNVSVLRCGKEAWNTSNEIVKIIRKSLVDSGLDENCVNLIRDTTHESVSELLNAVGYVDLLIPRGGFNLIKTVTENAKVPVVRTGTGICHVYVDETAEISMAVDIVNNAKTSRPSVCNSEEVCIVHKNIANEFLPALKNKLVDERNKNGLIPVELRLDNRAATIIDGTPAKDDDFDAEFLNYILAIKVVDSVDDAIIHISNHSTEHSESIISKDKESIVKFTSQVDSAAVYVNASTRFTDGGEFGLGCEIGISTQKLHARGPMGLEELCSYKYIIHGEGQIR